MSTVVQTTYRPQIAPAALGMVADLANSEVSTRICETAAGIGFGLAVSQGTLSNRGALLGGSSFIGISVRDVTVDRMPIDPLSSTETAADTYPQYGNMGVISRGHVWVMAGGNVSAGDPLYYDTTAGTFGNSASGESANGSITFSQQPTAGQTVTINGTTVTFESAPIGLNAPNAPALAAATTGGSLATGTVYVKVTYVNSAGETVASSEASIGVTGPTASVTVTGPANVVGATGYNVYSSGATGTEKLTNTNPINLGSNYTITALGAGVVAPGSANQVNLGATLGDTFTNLAATLNASSDTNLVVCKYAAFPPSPGGAGEGSGANTLQIADKTVGTAGNSIAFSTNVTGATVSGTTLAGGTASATAVPSGYWVTSALAGNLAKVSLAIQR